MLGLSWSKRKEYLMKYQRWIHGVLIVTSLLMLFSSYALIQIANNYDHPPTEDEYLVNHPEILAVTDKKRTLIHKLSSERNHLSTYKATAINYLSKRIQEGLDRLHIENYTVKAVFSTDSIIVANHNFPSLFSDLAIDQNLASINNVLSHLDKESREYKRYQMFDALDYSSFYDSTVSKKPTIKSGAALTVDIDHDGRTIPITMVVNESLVSYSFPYIYGSVIVTTDLLNATMYIEYVNDHPLASMGLLDAEGLYHMNQEDMHYSIRSREVESTFIHAIIEKAESAASISGKLIAEEFQGQGVGRLLESKDLHVEFYPNSLVIKDHEGRQFTAVIHYDSSDEYTYKFYVNQFSMRSMEEPLGALLYRIDGDDHSFSFVPYQEDYAIDSLLEQLSESTFKEVGNE